MLSQDVVTHGNESFAVGHNHKLRIQTQYLSCFLLSFLLSYVLIFLVIVLSLLHARNTFKSDCVVSYAKPEDYSVVTVPLPKLRDNDILIKVKACGVCGTDLHIHGYE